MRKLKLYIASTLDSYVAGPNDEIDWLETGGDLDYGYREFYASLDTTLMGNSTYGLALTADEFPYAEKTNYVFTRSALAPGTPYVKSVSGDIASFVRSLKGQTGEDIWLIGGGQVNTTMLNEGLINEIILTVFPLALGEGISLFAPGARGEHFETVGCETFPTGLTQWRLAKAQA